MHRVLIENIYHAGIVDRLTSKEEGVAVNILKLAQQIMNKRTAVALSLIGAH